MGGGSHKDPVLIICEQCSKKHPVEEQVEWYDPNDEVLGFDNNFKPKLRLFCSEDCKNKYIKGGVR